jgi:hypothetical protein
MSNDGAVARVSRLWKMIERKISVGEFDPATVATKLQIILDQPNPPWIVDDEGNIHFILISNGLRPQQWEKHLERRGRRITDWANQMLARANGASTKDVVYHVVVRPGKLIVDSERVTNKLRAYAAAKNWLTPHWEVACLIRDRFSDDQLRQMGLVSIITMHEPIRDESEVSFLLNANPHDIGGWLDACYDGSSNKWGDKGGFAFIEAQAFSPY